MLPTLIDSYHAWQTVLLYVVRPPGNFQLLIFNSMKCSSSDPIGQICKEIIIILSNCYRRKRFAENISIQEPKRLELAGKFSTGLISNSTIQEIAKSRSKFRILRCFFHD